MNRFNSNYWLILILLTCIGMGQKNNSAYLYDSLVHEGNVLKYRIKYPPNFDANTMYPLILFLHGRGESGDDNEKQLTHGGKLFVDNDSKYPAIVIFPQCPTNDYWATVSKDSLKRYTFYDSPTSNVSLGAVMMLANSFLSKSFIDTNRFYVTGLSMGAMGTWELLWRMKDKIAAAIPICGAGSTKKAMEMINTPVWAIHGVKDDVVFSRYSIQMVQKVQQAGGKAKITLVPEANHNSWDFTFAHPDYLPWLFKHTLVSQ